MYDPQAAAAKRQKKLEKRPRLTGFFDDDDEVRVGLVEPSAGAEMTRK